MYTVLLINRNVLLLKHESYLFHKKYIGICNVIFKLYANKETFILIFNRHIAVADYYIFAHLLVVLYSKGLTQYTKICTQ